MSVETTKEALGLLAAVQDPKQAAKILKQIQDEQAKLAEAQKAHAAERRECAKIRKEQRKMAETQAKLEAFAVAMREKGEALDAREKRVAQAEKDLRDIDEERKGLDKKIAYDQRKARSLNSKIQSHDMDIRALSACIEGLESAMTAAKETLVELRRERYARKGS